MAYQQTLCWIGALTSFLIFGRSSKTSWASLSASLQFFTHRLMDKVRRLTRMLRPNFGSCVRRIQPSGRLTSHGLSMLLTPYHPLLLIYHLFTPSMDSSHRCSPSREGLLRSHLPIGQLSDANKPGKELERLSSRCLLFTLGVPASVVPRIQPTKWVRRSGYLPKTFPSMWRV